MRERWLAIVVVLVVLLSSCSVGTDQASDVSPSENVEATNSRADSAQQGSVGARSSPRPEVQVSRLSLSGDGGRSTDFGSDCVQLSTIADYALVEVDGLQLQNFRAETIEDAIGFETRRPLNPYPHPPIVHWLIVDGVTTGTDAGESIIVIGYDAGDTPTVRLSVGANQLGFGLEVYTWCQPLDWSPDPELVFASAFDVDALGLDRSMRCSNFIFGDYASIEIEDGSRSGLCSTMSNFRLGRRYRHEFSALTLRRNCSSILLSRKTRSAMGSRYGARAESTSAKSARDVGRSLSYHSRGYIPISPPISEVRR